MGNTEKGFESLKTFIELNPDDASIYKWIGDLLYEGRSYNDALKSYAEYQQNDLESLIMRTKCLFRVGNLQEVNAMMKGMGKKGESHRLQLDEIAINLIGSLVKGECGKVLVSGVHKLNKLLE